MDINNLFPTVGTSGCGYSANQLTQSYTGLISSVGVSDSYFLGYVSPDMMPSTSFATKLKFEDDTFTLEPTSKNNVPVGYTWTTGLQFHNAYKDIVGSDVYNNSLGYVRYWNNFYPEFGAFPNELRLNFFGYLYNPDSTYNTSSTTITFTLNSFIAITRMLSGYSNITLSIGGKTFTFVFTDLTDGFINLTSADGYYGSFYLTSFAFSGGSIYNGSNSTSSYSQYGFNIKTFGDFDNGDSGARYILGTTFGSYDYLAMYYPTAAYNKFRYGSGGRNGGVYNTVTFDISDLPDSSNRFVHKDGILIEWQGSYNIAFYSYITNPSSIRNILGLCFRVNPSGIASYIEFGSYATDVTGSEFHARLKTGDINNAEFKAGLEPWQYVDFDTYDPDENPQGAAENEFTEDDIPPYTPTPPEPEEGHSGTEPAEPVLDPAGYANGENDEDIGSTPINLLSPPDVPGQFFTRYLVSPNDVRLISNEMNGYLQVDDLDFIKNFFMTATGTTTSFTSLFDIISYTVSLKYFPLDLPNLVHTTGTTGYSYGTGYKKVLENTPSTLVESSYITFSGGACLVKYATGRAFNSSYDLEPYVTGTVYVPYCGTIDVPMSMVYGKTLELVYGLDLITGNCTAVLMCNGYLVGSINGTMGFEVMMTGNNAATASANANAVLSNSRLDRFASVFGAGINTMASVAGNSGGKVDGGFSGASGGGGGGGTMGAISAGLPILSSAANFLIDSAKENTNLPLLTQVQPTLVGGCSNMSSLIMPQVPYLQVRRHNALMTGQGYEGYMVNSAYKLANCSGYTQANNVALNFNATQSEKEQIKMLLGNGVFIKSTEPSVRS